MQLSRISQVNCFAVSCPAKPKEGEHSRQKAGKVKESAKISIRR
jgi:hypothetical protein